ncbi:uncharacterized protein LOC143277851 [Babylonia areolata]|uniref:uncharacterized protein LOC143277851 n=1 Tax=Babylonia areolata TaxID=304850 RepID=UPI003FD5432B
MHLWWLRFLSAVGVVVVQWCGAGVRASLPELDADKWILHVRETPAPDILVLLYTENSKPCETAEQVIETMIQDGEMEQVQPGVRVVKQKAGGPLSTGLGLSTFPALVLLRDGITAYYTGVMEESSEVYMWLDKAGRKAVSRELGDDTFEHLTQASTGSTTGHWLVLFYRSDCQDHFSLLESVGISEKLWMNVARVNLDGSPKLAKRFQVSSCPEIIYFREGKMYRYETKKYDVPSVTSFVTSWFRNVKASTVPLSPTTFDELTEAIALYLKTQLEGENRTFALVVTVGGALTIVLTSLFCCLTGGSDSKQKTE